MGVWPHLKEPLQVDVVLLLFLWEHVLALESRCEAAACTARRRPTNLLAALLEHVLLLLRHHLPLFAAQHHALCAGDVLHVHHQLSAVQRVAVAGNRRVVSASYDEGGLIKNVVANSRWRLCRPAIKFVF